MLKHCLSLKTFIPNFVAFFVSLGIVISCIHKMSFSVTLAKREFTPAGHCFIIHLPGGGHCPLSEIANQSGCLKYQRHRVCRRVATCKPGKPGLTSFSETLALFFIQFLSFRKMKVQDRQNGSSK